MPRCFERRHPLRETGQRASKVEIKQRVGEALGMVQMADYGRRKPSQLSGGQQQRVALARALVMAPGALGTTEAVHRGRERFAGADRGFFDRCGYHQVVQPL